MGGSRLPPLPQGLPSAAAFLRGPAAPGWGVTPRDPPQRQSWGPPSPSRHSPWGHQEPSWVLKHLRQMIAIKRDDNKGCFIKSNNSSSSREAAGGRCRLCPDRHGGDGRCRWEDCGHAVPGHCRACWLLLPQIQPNFSLSTGGSPRGRGAPQNCPTLTLPQLLRGI